MQISCASTVLALQNRGMRHVSALRQHVKVSTSAYFHPKWEVVRNSSSTASSHASSLISSGSSSVDSTIIIKKQFFLQVHPDFFQHHPREQNINSENLKVLNNFFDTSSQRSSSLASTISRPSAGTGASPRDLVFYVKARALPPRTSSAPNSISLPSRVVVPLNDRVFHSLHEILSSHCKLGSSLPSPSPSPAPAGPDHRSSTWDHLHEQAYDDWRWAWRRPSAEDEDEGWAPFLDRFVAHLQRRETKRGGGQIGRRGDGLGTLQDRKEAAQHMEATGARICAKWGFESVQLHSDWAAEHLALTLWRLEAALEEYGNDAFRVTRFAGFDLVLTPSRSPSLSGGHPHLQSFGEEGIVKAAAKEGRLNLSPSDTPLHWIELLRQVGVQDVREAKGWRKEEANLVAAFQSYVLPDAHLERGCTCSRSQYIAWLQSLGGGGESGLGGRKESMELIRPWEHLRMRVESDIRPSVLECGVLQVDHARLPSKRAVLELAARLGPAAAEARATFKSESRLLREVEAVCVSSAGLGLKGVRKESGVSTVEMVGCLERLLALPVGDRTREGLKGLDVVVGKTYGITREGSVLLPWNWVTRGETRWERSC